MAITYPRALPAVRIKSSEFTLITGVIQNRNRFGKTMSIENAAPRWSVAYTTVPLDRRERQMITAWWNSLRGLKKFYGHHPDRVYPVSYPDGFAGLSKHGGGAFDGTAAVVAVTSSTIQLSGLPSTFALKAGDMVGLVKDDRRGLHEIVEDATAVDGVVTVTVTPSVLTSVYAGASAQLHAPVCVMVPVADSLKIQDAKEMSTISFSGEQAVL